MKKVTKSMIQSFQKFKQDNQNQKNDVIDKAKSTEEKKKINQVIINNSNTRKLHITIDNSNDLFSKSGTKKDKSPTFIATRSLNQVHHTVKKQVPVPILDKDAFLKDKNKDNDKQRRKKLGLNFLNKLSTKKIKGIVSSNKCKIKQLEDVKKESNPTFFENNHRNSKELTKKFHMTSPKLRDISPKQDIHFEERPTLFTQQN